MIDAVAKSLALWAVPYNDWDAISEDQRERWRSGARLAMEALSNPTDAMIAGGVARDPLACDVPDDEVKMIYTRIWQGMIDAALTPADG